ncbi:MAG: hypothetical protein K6F37_04170 [Lachnospiraceae bacterium]|nr:hypothetical protein [Lachnospiraceae bacterium]
MSKKNKVKKVAVELTEEQMAAEKKADFKSALVMFYFVLCLFITALATDNHMFTYGQLSIIYLPMFFIFIYWLMQRMKNPDDKHGRLGNIIGIALCIVVILMTGICFVASCLGIFE